ncbi:MAG TPA: TIR domain-containing protein [Pyrinomonadaceae bacterium]|nr:TIR domain-containing protein [Pyrinomonadaceae bacterium]
MKKRPTIFLSCVASEFRSYRDAVEIEIENKGCFAANQSSFGLDYRTIEEVLRQRIQEADAVVHIVGFRFGPEPNDPPSEKPRRSFTQMEYDIAHELKKPVYVFLSASDAVSDAPYAYERPEDTETVTLQRAHRGAVVQSDDYRIFKDKEELCRFAAEIPLVTEVDFREDISRISEYAPANLVGRDDEMRLLDETWLKVSANVLPRPRVVSFVAAGGQGKTALVAKWMQRQAERAWPDCDAAFAWCFYSGNAPQGPVGTSDLFLKEAISFFGKEADKQFASSRAINFEKGQRLAQIISERRCLLVLDGLEPLQSAPTASTPATLTDAGLIALLRGLATHNRGLCIITARYSVSELTEFGENVSEVKLPSLSRAAGAHLLKALGVKGNSHELETIVDEVHGHALALKLSAYVRDARGRDFARPNLMRRKSDATEQDQTVTVLENLEEVFVNDPRLKVPLAILNVLALFDRSAEPVWIANICQPPVIPGLTDLILEKTALELCADIAEVGPGIINSVGGNWREGLDPNLNLSMHPSFATYLRGRLKANLPEAWSEAHRRLCLFFTRKLSDQITGVDDLATIQRAFYHGSQGGVLPSVTLKEWLMNVIENKSVPEEQTALPEETSTEDGGPTRSVFISYRRAGDAAFLARTIRAELRRRGCAVFLDVDSLRTGRFDDALLNEIRNAQNFLVILSPDSLERTANPEDWFRRELACALSGNRNIIPVFMDGFGWPEPEKLPEDIRRARTYHGLHYSHDYFEAMMDKVEGFLR